MKITIKIYFNCTQCFNVKIFKEHKDKIKLFNWIVINCIRKNKFKYLIELLYLWLQRSILKSLFSDTWLWNDNIMVVKNAIKSMIFKVFYYQHELNLYAL